MIRADYHDSKKDEIIYFLKLKIFYHQKTKKNERILPQRTQRTQRIILLLRARDYNTKTLKRERGFNLRDPRERRELFNAKSKRYFTTKH